MAAYLDSAGLALLSVMPASYISELETTDPGWVDAQLESWSAWLDARLSKRYAAPFSAPYPFAVTNWLQRIVTHRCYLKRGVDPTDAQSAAIEKDANDAMAEVKEAADSESGLFDLPLNNSRASAITKTAPLGYTEVSPYTWTTHQRDDAYEET